MVKIKQLQKYTVQLITECFATCILIFIGEAAIANYKFAGETSRSKLPIAITFGVGVYAAMMLAGPISEAHLNPALSISLMTIRKLNPLQCIFYVIGQISGAFLGAALVYLVFWSQFDKLDGGIRQIAGGNGTGDIFFTMPDEGLSHWNTFIDQVVSTAFLLIFVMTVAQKFNKMTSEVSKPIAFALVVTAITSAFSINAGAAINPARDLGPRLFAAFVYGWSNVFSADNYFFWVPIIGPVVGGILGVWIYQGYLWIVKEYGHFPEIKHSDSDTKNDSNDLQMKDVKDLAELQEKLTKIDS